MDYSKLKFFLSVAVALFMLLAPFALDITPDGKAFAMGSRGGGNGGSQAIKTAPPKTKWKDYKILTTEDNGNPQGIPATHKVPEPTTLILVGSGLAGLAIFRKKFKK